MKLRLKGFLSAKLDSTVYRPKAARYQSTEEITFEELADLTTTADLTGVDYTYDPPEKGSKESIRMTDDEMGRINRNFGEG